MSKTFILTILFYVCASQLAASDHVPNYYVEAGEYVGIEPWLLWAVADTESAHNPHAINRNTNGTYDIGVMQINSIHFKRFKLMPEDLYDPRINIFVGAIILKECFEKHGNNWMAINCYNGLSPANKKHYVYANKVYKHLLDGKHKYARQE